MAITWRNVGGGDNAGALRNLMAASSGITGAFDSLRGVVRDAELADKQNFDLQKAENTSNFLDTLQSQYASPEALQAAIASGEVNALRQGYGRNIDANAVRGAAESRLTNLRQQDTANRQFANQVTDDRDQTAISRLQAAAISGDPTAVQELANISDRNKGKGAGILFNAERDRFGFSTEQEKERDRNESHALQLRQGESQIQANNASMAASRAATAASNFRTQLGKLDLEDKIQSRGFQKGIEEEVRRHQQDSNYHKQNLRTLARENPSMFPMKDGEVNITGMDRGQREAADALLAVKGMAPLSEIEKGDTRAQERLIAKLASAGAPLALMESVKKNGDWFNTSKLAPVGNDAVLVAQREAQKKIFEEHTFAAAGGIPSKAGDFTEVMKTIGPSIPKEGSDSIKRALSTYFKDGGVDIEGVKRYLPSNVIAQVVQGAKNPWGWNDEGDYVLNALQKADKDFKLKLSGAVKSETDRAVRSTVK